MPTNSYKCLNVKYDISLQFLLINHKSVCVCGHESLMRELKLNKVEKQLIRASYLKEATSKISSLLIRMW